MNLIHPLKYHYYSYRKPYLIYLLIFLVGLFLIPLLFDHLVNFYYYYPIALLLITFAFTIINSIYEFTILINHYFKLKTIKSEFCFASIIYSIINSLIQTILLLVAFLITNYVFNQSFNSTYEYTSPLIYIFTFIVQFSLFGLIGIISLFIRNVKYVQALIYFVILLIVALISFEIIKSIVDFIYNLYHNHILILNILPISIIITIALYMLIYYRINEIYE